jgi:3-dehydroquinate synthase II
MKDVIVQPPNRDVAAKAVEDGFTSLLLTEPDDGLGRIDVLILDDGAVRRDGKHVGDYVRIRSKQDEQAVAALKGKRDLVVVDAQDWKVIPLENLIAALAGQTKLYAVARDAQEAELFLTTLEKGVDGVVVRPKTVADLAPYRRLLDDHVRRRLDMTEGTVTKVQPVGMGERVCIDTCNILTEGEGMLIGSSSRGFFLVAAETKETEYVRARPFRVNAGAVHSYVLTGEKTNYLSELESGNRLEAVGRDGSARPVVVGRCKVETRPLVLVEAKTADGTYRVILQNAETIRLVPPEGEPISVSQLKPGDTVLMHLEQAARHFGMAVDERLEER